MILMQKIDSAKMQKVARENDASSMRASHLN